MPFMRTRTHLRRSVATRRCPTGLGSRHCAPTPATPRRAAVAAILLTLLCDASVHPLATFGAEPSRESMDFPAGWVGVHVGMAMAVTEGSGVHLGAGWIVTAAHVVSGYAVGWNVEIFEPAARGRPTAFRRARLMRVDEREDVALLRAEKPQGLSSVPICEAGPASDETVSFYAMTRERRIVSGIPRSLVRFMETRTIPVYPEGIPAARLSGLERDAYRGSAEAGMSGGGAYAADGSCVYGILSLVDPVGDQGRPIAYAVPPRVFQSWLPRSAESSSTR